MATVSEVRAALAKMPHNKRVCFSNCPAGLSFYRVKGRGGVLQIEFNQSVDRDQSGRLIVEQFGFIGAPDLDDAPTVGWFVDDLDAAGYLDKPLIFGGDEHALTFVGVSEHGDWVSIDFKEHVYRGRLGAMIVEEYRDGKLVVEAFPVER